MKKLLILALCAVLLLSAGCAKPITAPSETGKPADNSTAVATPPLSTARPETSEPTDLPATELPTVPDTGVPTEAPAVPSTAPTAEATSEPAPTEPIDPWSLMDELSFEQGVYEDDLGNIYSYSYGLPCIKADTEGARAINAEIEEIYGGEVVSAHQAMAEKLSLYMISMGYHGEVWEDVLTLVISTHTDWGDDSYGIYSYEVSTGRWLSTKDILDRLHISEKQFLETCRQQFRQYFIESNSGIPADKREVYGYYDALDRVDDELYLSMDLQVYPNADGELVVAAPIVSLAGADFYYHLLTLEFD